MIFGTFDASARKALSLNKDRVFRAFTILIVILGWVCGIGTAGLVTLENVYGAWQLKQRSQLTLYLSTDVTNKEIEEHLVVLNSYEGVESSKVLTDVETRALLEPYFENAQNFPVPKVVEFDVTQRLNRLQFDGKVLELFPTAEIDDARSVLESVARAVRATQGVTLALSGIVFAIVAFVVSLVVRAGVRGQSKSLKMLQYMGASDSFLIRLILNQVFLRASLGWAFSTVIVAVTLLMMMIGLPELVAYMRPSVWIAAALVPVGLVIVALGMTYHTMKHMVKSF
jgi:cell division protein FtsX